MNYGIEDEIIRALKRRALSTPSIIRLLSGDYSSSAVRRRLWKLSRRGIIRRFQRLGSRAFGWEI